MQKLKFSTVFSVVSLLFGEYSIAMEIPDQKTDLNSNNKAQINVCEEAGPSNSSTCSSDMNIDEKLYGLVEHWLNCGLDVNETNKDGDTSLIKAIEKGSMKLVELLISKGADINQKNNKGETPLMKACMCGRIDIAYFLISKGADINSVDNNNNSVLHHIFKAQKKHLEATNEKNK